MASTYDQTGFRGRNDDVVLNSATFNGGGGLNTNWTQLSDTAFRIRFLILETGTGATADRSFTLFYKIGAGGTYAQIDDGVGGNPSVYSTETTQYTNQATTTQVIGAGTYIAGESKGGVQGEGNLVTGNVDVELNKEFEVEFCVLLDGSVFDEGDQVYFQVRFSNSTVLNAYTVTPIVTVTLPPLPDVAGYLGDVLWQNDHSLMTQWVGNDYYNRGNINTHPSSVQPQLVRLAVYSFRMKAEGVAGPGLFPAGADDTVTQTITTIQTAGTYVYTYYQVEHDVDEGPTTRVILSGVAETEVLRITGPEAADETVWAGPFHHVFEHLGGNLKLRIYYKAPAVPDEDNSGIKDTAMMIREHVSIGTVGLTASATVRTPGLVALTLPARSLATTINTRSVALTVEDR